MSSEPAPEGGVHNFYEGFTRTAGCFPEHVAIEMQRRDGLESVTFEELRNRAEAVCAFLVSRGVAAGDACAIQADNDIAWCAVYLGILRLGAVAVPLDTHYTSPQIARLLQDSGAKILFTTFHHLTAAEEALRIVSFAADLVLLHGRAPGISSLEEFAWDNCQLPPCPARLQDPAVILYTSGTTSDPKGVVLTHDNILSEAEAAFQVLHVDERDCILAVLPLFHALAQMANLLLPLLVGARIVFLEELNTAELLRALRERNPTAFCCVPKFFYLIHDRVFIEVAKAGLLRSLAFRMLLRANGGIRRFLGINLGPLIFRRIHDAFGRRMRLLITGGARFDFSVGSDFYKLGFSLIEAYGLTESSGAATLTRPGEGGLGTVGRPLPGVEVRIFPVEGIGAGSSREGEIAIRGPIVMQGYLKRLAATAEAIREGWLMTGDLGCLDPEGRLIITGRKKEVIVLSSGKNIYPEEVEAHYGQSPCIKELCVLGMPARGERRAEGLHGVIVPDLDVMRARRVINLREVLRFEIENLSIRLPSHQRILSYEIWMEALPRTTTNKLKRYEIEKRARFQQEAAEEAPAAIPLSDEDAAWVADPTVARALELVQEATRHKQEVRPDANLELDLGIDSVERVELLTNLETLFGARISEEAAQSAYTVRQIIDAVRAQQTGPVSPGMSGEAWRKLLADVPEKDPLFSNLLKGHSIFLLLLFGTLKIVRVLARLFLGFRVTGVGNIPKQGPFLLCPNHQSYLDPFLLVSALPFRTFRDLFFVGASEYFATPVRRAAASLMHIAPVDPDTNLVRALQAGAFGLKHGRILVLFPEGERSIDGEVKKFKKGVAILSFYTGAPIVPAAFEGVFDVWPRNRAFRWSAFFPWKHTRTQLRFGRIIPTPPAIGSGASSSQMETQYAAFAEQVREAVIQMQLALREPADRILVR